MGGQLGQVSGYTALDNPRAPGDDGAVEAKEPSTPFRYCGRSFTPEEIERIRRITDDPHQPTRREIARAVCAALNWNKPDGESKLVSGHVALRRMEAHRVIWLPLPTREAVRPRTPRRTPAGDPQASITGSRGDLSDLRCDLVESRNQAVLWNDVFSRNHYFGRGPSAGAQGRYLAYDARPVL